MSDFGLGDVFDAFDAVVDVFDENGIGDVEDGGKVHVKSKFPMEEPVINEFGRVTEWYHCGIRNTGSVCKNCGEYRRDRTSMTDEIPETGDVPGRWKCRVCGQVNNGGRHCSKCAESRWLDDAEVAEKQRFFVRHPMLIPRAILVLRIIATIALMALMVHGWS